MYNSRFDHPGGDGGHYPRRSNNFQPEIVHEAEDAEAYVLEELDRGVHPVDLEMRCQDIAQTAPLRSQEYRMASATLVVLNYMCNRGDFDSFVSSREHGNGGINRRSADEIDLDGIAVRIGQLNITHITQNNYSSADLRHEAGGDSRLYNQIRTQGRANGHSNLNPPPSYTRGRLPWNRRETVVADRLTQHNRQFGIHRDAEDYNARSHNSVWQDLRRSPPGPVAPSRRRNDFYRNEDDVQVNDFASQAPARGRNPFDRFATEAAVTRRRDGNMRGYDRASRSINYRYVDPQVDDYDDPYY